MSLPLPLQFALGILTGLVMAGSWWFVALRLPSYWGLYALAMMATAGVVTSVALAVLFASHQSHNLIGPVSQLRTGVGVLDAILYIFFAGWITSRVKTRA